MPDIQPNLIAILVAVVINFFVSYIWYMPLFGKAWAREMGVPEDRKETGRELAKGLLLTLLSCALMAFVLSSNIAAWTPSTWGSSLPGLPPMAQAFQAAFFTWIGYAVPVLLRSPAWEGKSWKLFAINAGYFFVVLFISATCIVLIR
jgi:hypothetical protein